MQVVDRLDECITQSNRPSHCRSRWKPLNGGVVLMQVGFSGDVRVGPGPGVGPKAAPPAGFRWRHWLSKGLWKSPPVREGECTGPPTVSPPAGTAPGPGLGKTVSRRRTVTPIPGRRGGTPSCARSTGMVAAPNMAYRSPLCHGEDGVE